MLVTKEQQEALLNAYMKEPIDINQCTGFVNGLNAMLNLISKISSNKNTCTFYRGFVIQPNNTGYVNFDFFKSDSEVILGNGKTIQECKNQIDELLENE